MSALSIFPNGLLRRHCRLLLIARWRISDRRFDASSTVRSESTKRVYGDSVDSPKNSGVNGFRAQLSAAEKAPVHRETRWNPQQTLSSVHTITTNKPTACTWARTLNPRVDCFYGRALFTLCLALSSESTQVSLLLSLSHLFTIRHNHHHALFWFANQGPFLHMLLIWCLWWYSMPYLSSKLFQ